MSLATEQLEQLALKHATLAIQLERQGSKDMAVNNYQKAVDLLMKICSLNPNNTWQNRLYMERVGQFRDKIKALKETPQFEEESAGGVQQPAKFEQLVITEKPNVKWEDVADLAFAKRAIQDSIIYPTKRPDLYPLGWPRGILMFGPPGCGKTLLAAAVATEINAVFYQVDAASIMSKWLGESEKNVAQLFNDARAVAEKEQPAIVFMDEFDSLVGKQVQEIGGEVRTRNQFLKEMDSIADKSRNLLVYVIGATNKPWSLDEPFIRRFQKRIFVPLPDINARLEMFQIYTKNLKLGLDVDINGLAQLTEGYSGSDIRDICQAVQIKVVREFFESGAVADPQAQTRLINMQDFRDILAERKPSVSQEFLKHYEEWYKEYEAL